MASRRDDARCQWRRRIELAFVSHILSTTKPGHGDIGTDHNSEIGCSTDSIHKYNLATKYGNASPRH